MVAKMTAPRAIWVMLPAGEATGSTIEKLATLVSPGDVIIDGGNSFWKDDIRRGRALACNSYKAIEIWDGAEVKQMVRDALGPVPVQA